LLLGLLWIVPEICLMGYGFFFFYGLCLFIDVKDASSTHPRALIDLLAGLM